AGLQPGPETLGRRERDRRGPRRVAPPAVRAELLAVDRSQTPHPARIVRAGRRLLLLLRALLRGPLHRGAARGEAGLLPRPHGPHAAAATGEGRLVVGLSAVRLPPTVRHGVRDSLP